MNCAPQHQQQAGRDQGSEWGGLCTPTCILTQVVKKHRLHCITLTLLFWITFTILYFHYGVLNLDQSAIRLNLYFYKISLNVFLHESQTHRIEGGSYKSQIPLDKNKRHTYLGLFRHRKQLEGYRTKCLLQLLPGRDKAAKKGADFLFHLILCFCFSAGAQSASSPSGPAQRSPTPWAPALRRAPLGAAVLSPPHTPVSDSLHSFHST